MTSSPPVNPFRPLIPFQAALLLHLAVYLALPGKLASLPLVILSGMAAALAVGAGALGLLPAAVWTGGRWRRFAGGLMAALALTAFAFGMVMRPEWIYAHIALTVALVGAALVRALDPEGWHAPVRLRRAALIGVGAAVAGVIALRALALAYAPVLQITDEPWHLGWVMGVLREGRFTDYLMYFGGHDVQRYYAPMALWLSVAGVGLWEARLYSFAVTLAVAAVGGLAAARLYGRAAGWIAGLLLFASATVLIGARIRHDAGLALAIAVSLWLYAEGLRRGRGYHLLAGLAMGVGWFAHYHAIVFGMALLVGLYLPRWWADKRGRRALDALAYGMGGALGAAAVVLLQVAPHLRQGDALARSGRGASDLFGIAASVWAHVESIGQHSQLEMALVIAALALALWRGRALERTLALTLILCHSGLGLVQREAWSHYPMPLTPLYMALIAGMIAGAAPALKRGALLVALLLALPTLGWTLQTPLVHAVARDPVRPPPPPAAQWVLDNIEPGAVIAGEHYYYLWLTDYRYVSPLTPNFMPDIAKTRLPALDLVWDEIDPVLYIIDPNLSTCCVLQWMIDGGYLAARGYEIAAQFAGERFPITIYRAT